MHSMKIISLLAVTAGYTLGADAAIISLKADDSVGGFTSSTSPALFTSTPAADDDDAWGYDSTNNQALLGTTVETTNLANQVWISRGDLSPGGEDAPQLTTTISGLDIGTQYNLYLYHVTNDSTSSNWRLTAGIDGFADSELYIENGGTVLEENEGLNLERVFLGTVTGVTSADILIDDEQGTQVRGFYKGVGVELVPEPGSLALLAMGGLLMAKRRRRN